MKKLLLVLMLMVSTAANAVVIYRPGIVEKVVAHGDPALNCAQSGRGNWPSSTPSLPGQMCATSGAYFEIVVNVDGNYVTMNVSKPYYVGDRVKVRIDFNVE